MAQEAVNGILQALMAAQQRRVQYAKMAQEQTAEANLQGYRQQEIENQRNQLSEHARQFDITTKAAQAMHKLAMLEQEQKLTSGLQSGEQIPGANVMSTRTDAEGNDFNTYQLPIQDDSGNNLNVELPTPLTHAKQQAKLSAITMGPAVEAKLRETQAAKDADLQRLLLGKEWEDKRTRYHESQENLRNALTNQTRLQAAQIRKAEKIADNEGDFDPFIHGLTDGTYNTDDVKKMFPKAAPQIFTSVTKAGAIPLTKTQQDAIKELVPAISVIDKMDQFIGKQPDHSNTAGAMMSGLTQVADPEMNRLGNEIDGVLPGITRSISGLGSNRLNKSELDMARNGFVPNRFQPKTSNIQKRNDYVRLLDRYVDVKLGDLPEAQKSLIKSKIGLTNIGEFGGTPAPISNNQPTSDSINKLLQKYSTGVTQ